MKAEAAKLPGAGISPKPCPRKCTAGKGHAPHSVRIGMRGRLGPATSSKNKRSRGQCSERGIRAHSKSTPLRAALFSFLLTINMSERVFTSQDFSLPSDSKLSPAVINQAFCPQLFQKSRSNWAAHHGRGTCG